MRKKKNKFLYILLFIILLPLIIIELLFKGIVRLIKKNKSAKEKFGDKEFYESLNIEKVDIMDGVEFERFLKRLFIYKGYTVSETARTGDFGADLILSKDGKKIVVQAKRYSAKVGAKALQEIYSARHHYKADEMMVVCNTHFTKQAEVMAQEQQIELVDREELIGIINEVKEELKQNLTDELKQEIDESSGEIVCDNFKYRI